MKKLLIPAALIALCTALQAAPQAGTQALSAADQALLKQVTPAQHQALIYIASECGFEPSPKLATVLLKTAAFKLVADAMANPDLTPPELDAKRCAAFTGN